MFDLEASLEKTLADVQAHKRGEDVGVVIHSVFVPPDVDVAEIRRQLGLTQAQFAERYGLSLGAVRKWERAERRPDAAARTLLYLIGKEPDTIDRLLAS